ncbi:YybH family protein [Rhizomicrobium electricum]|uniref:SnoaL-like domain-containing protein n=1 Tax=Rhizomicrobium electricum TaxID=480070 RepID=A0ABP3P5T5_9PROT|nr:nuclear transport factor 2 family protein [Rhizomicrobium electricum]NIJ47494.1 ketosteroid isomerase-like protein [Rhizomicrobium electricum]
MLKFILTAIAMTAAVLPAAAAAEDVPATIIAMERAALDRSDKGDVQGFLEISAPDVVYQDPALDAPLIGLPALTAYYAKFPAGEPSHGVMSNANVQVLGNVAVLSFHYVSRSGTPKEIVWNCTEVYRKTDGNWRIVNTHWSLTKPLPQKLD